jgi:hypothetical protein
MKKVILATILGLSLVGTASAQHRGYYPHGGYYRGGCYGCGWVAPVLIGGVIGYELSRQAPVVVQQQPVIIEQQPVLQQPPVGYHWQEMIDPQTNTRKIVLVPNQ